MFVWFACVIDMWALVHLVYESDQSLCPRLDHVDLYKLTHEHQYVSDIYTNFVDGNTRTFFFEITQYNSDIHRTRTHNLTSLI